MPSHAFPPGVASLAHEKTWLVLILGQKGRIQGQAEGRPVCPQVGRSQAARSHLIADRMSGEATIGSEVVPPRGKERLFNGIALPAPSPFTDRAAKGAAPAGARGDRWGDTRDVAARGIGAPRPTMETLGSRSMQMEGFEDGFSHPSK